MWIFCFLKVASGEFLECLIKWDKLLFFKFEASYKEVCCKFVLWHQTKMETCRIYLFVYIITLLCEITKLYLELSSRLVWDIEHCLYYRIMTLPFFNVHYNTDKVRSQLFTCKIEFTVFSSLLSAQTLLIFVCVCITGDPAVSDLWPVVVGVQTSRRGRRRVLQLLVAGVWLCLIRSEESGQESSDLLQTSSHDGRHDISLCGLCQC